MVEEQYLLGENIKKKKWKINLQLISETPNFSNIRRINANNQNYGVKCVCAITESSLRLHMCSHWNNNFNKMGSSLMRALAIVVAIQFRFFVSSVSISIHSHFLNNCKIFTAHKMAIRNRLRIFEFQLNCAPK